MNITSGIFIAGSNIAFTPEGGIAVRYFNRTGVASVKGTLVKFDAATDRGVILTGDTDTECIGVIYENGIADDSLVWVVVEGRAQVLLKDTTDATHGNWATTSDTAGRALCSGASPAAAPTHFEEIGHVEENQTSGSDVLCFIKLQFN